MSRVRAPAPQPTENPREQRATQIFGQLCLACGALAPLVWGGMIVWAASTAADYSHRRDVISALALGDDGSATAMRALGFGLSGALYMIAGLYAAIRFRRDPAAILASLLLVIGGLARIGGGIYPCAAGCLRLDLPEDQRMHLWTMAAMDVSLIFATAAWGVVVNRYARLKWISSLSFGATSWTVVSMVMMATSVPDQGLYQRYANGILGVWMLVWAVALWRSRIWAEDLDWRKPQYAPRHRRFRRK